MDKSVFVTNAEPWNPPFVEVGMISISDMNAAPPADLAFITVIKKLQAIEVVEVPSDGSIFTIDLEGVESLVTPCIAGRFKQAERSVVEVAVENTGIIDGDRLFLSGGSVHPFLNEGLGDGRDILNPTIEPDGSINTVGQKITCHTRSGCGCIQAPQSLSALRQFFTDGPVLKKVGSVVKHFAEFS